MATDSLIRIGQYPESFFLCLTYVIIVTSFLGRLTIPVYTFIEVDPEAGSSEARPLLPVAGSCPSV